MLSDTLQFVFSGLTTGSTYVLLALGFTLVYSTTGLLNFAMGGYVLVGGTTYIYTMELLPNTSPFLALLVATGAGAVLGWLTYQLLRVPESDSLLVLGLITFGLAMIAEGAILILQGPDPHFGPALIGAEGRLSVGGAVISYQVLTLVAVTVVTLVLLEYFLGRTRLGRSMRATADDRDAAALKGIDVRFVTLSAFVLSGVLGGAAGGFVAPTTGIRFDNAVTLSLLGFVAATIGGLGSRAGAVIGGMSIGVATGLLTGWLSARIAGVLVLLSLVILLMIRPKGLLGRIPAVSLDDEAAQL